MTLLGVLSPVTRPSGRNNSFEVNDDDVAAGCVALEVGFEDEAEIPSLDPPSGVLQKDACREFESW